MSLSPCLAEFTGFPSELEVILCGCAPCPLITQSLLTCLSGPACGALNAACHGDSDAGRKIAFLTKASGFHDACDGPALYIQLVLVQTREAAKVAAGSENGCAAGCPMACV